MDVVSQFLEHRYHKPVFIAHRGESENYPENTIPAFKSAVTDGCKWVELDVQLTKDAVPVVMHDPDLKRFTKSNSKVEQLTFKELQAIDAGSWKDPAFSALQIPSLNQVLDELNGVGVNIELKREIKPEKRSFVVEMIASIVKNRHIQQNLIISSFDHEFLNLSKQIMPDVATGLLYTFSFRNVKKNILTLIRDTKADFFHCSVKQANSAWMNILHKHNIPCNVYTVNDLNHLLRLKKMGVSGIFTDRPSALSHQYDELLKRG